MILTDEQYNQIIRYVDGEMDAAESNAFKIALLQSSELLEEVEAYKELRQISKSVAQKMDQLGKEYKEADDKIVSIIERARMHWEEHDEEDWKHRLDILPIEELATQSKADDKRMSIQEETQLVTENTTTQPFKGKIKGINTWKWLSVAAALIGLVALGVIWWYAQDKESGSKVSINNKRTDSQIIANNKKSDSQRNIIGPDTSSHQVNVHPSNSTNPLPKERIEKTETDHLVVSNFEPDALPSQIPKSLENPSNYYKDNKFEDAIAGYKNVIKEIKTAQDEKLTKGRNEENELTRFYAQYYLAQSYLAINYTAKAIKELESAIKDYPTLYWKSKTQWYLALAYLKIGQIQKTRALLKQVELNDPSGDYQQKAIQLKKVLERK